MSRVTVDCIIPFYNEAGRIIEVIGSALATEEINSVICVNDGSTDDVSIDSFILSNKKLKLLSHPINQGKTQAIQTGLEDVKTDYVFLIDADLIGLTPTILSKIINYTLTNNLDMMILRRIKTLPITKFLKMDILEAGERLLKTNDLRKILSQKLVGYELEPAINNYYLSKNSRVAYTTQPVEQYRKVDKIGLVGGIRGDLRAMWEVVKYAGVRKLWQQIRDFHPKMVKI